MPYIHYVPSKLKPWKTAPFNVYWAILGPSLGHKLTLSTKFQAPGSVLQVWRCPISGECWSPLPAAPDALGSTILITKIKVYSIYIYGFDYPWWEVANGERKNDYVNSIKTCYVAIRQENTTATSNPILIHSKQSQWKLGADIFPLGPAETSTVRTEQWEKNGDQNEPTWHSSSGFPRLPPSSFPRNHQVPLQRQPLNKPLNSWIFGGGCSTFLGGWCLFFGRCRWRCLARWRGQSELSFALGCTVGSILTSSYIQK